MIMLRHAFKEWAVICRALAEGRQAIILRKGGISEKAGEFVVEHTRFWLFPTYAHQQRTGIRPEAHALLEEVEAERPPAGVVRLSHFAEVGGAYRVRDLTRALLLAHLHLWSEETVRSRFNYRDPGLFVIPVRVYRAKEGELPMTPYYAGCKSWVELEQELPTKGARPVLKEADFRDVHRSLDLLLNPTALA
jgi:hypothetical protein